MVDRTYVRGAVWTKAFLTEPAQGRMERVEAGTVLITRSALHVPQLSR